jgi:LacI family transcriptional regulator
MEDVAVEAQVSVATVSNVISGQRRASPETRKRVFAAIEKLGYRPNEMARSLRRRETLTIAVLISDVRNPFYTEVLRGIEDIANEHRYSVILANSDERHVKQEEYLRVLSARRVDGFIVSPTGKRSDELAAIRERGTPVVYINRRPPDVDRFVLTADNIGGAELAVAHLIEDQRAAGIEQPRIGIITGRSGVSTTEDRLTGYRQALQRHGLPYRAELVEVGHSSVEGGEVAARLLLRREPSGMFITNNQMTIGAVQVLRLQGKQWPEPLGLVGFDDGDYARLIMPELTVVSQPTALLGKRAARLLLDLIEGRQPDEQPALPTELVVRASCSRPCAEAYWASKRRSMEAW